MTASCSRSAEDIERLARRRAALRLGWHAHALAYVAVNGVLVLLSALGGRHWAMFPVLGWGLGLAIHGVVVFLATGGAGLHQRLLQQERRRLAVRRDPW